MQHLDIKKGDGCSPAPPFFIDCKGTPRIYILVRIVVIFGLLLMGNYPLMNDFPRAAERRKCSCVHSLEIPGRIARRVAVARRDRADPPPRTDRLPAVDGT